MTKQDLVDIFHYLDSLRKSGITNMFAAGPYVMEEFTMSQRESCKAVGLWMRTYRSNSAPFERATEAYKEMASMV